jgi:hypothetical protein
MKLRGIFLLLLVLCFFSQATAASHLVSDQEILAKLSNAAADRASKIQTIEKLLRHETIQAQIGGMLDLAKIEQALPALDDETLDRLAAESRELNDELEGGEVCAATIALIVLLSAVIVVAIVAWA